MEKLRNIYFNFAFTIKLGNEKVKIGYFTLNNAFMYCTLYSTDLQGFKLFFPSIVHCWTRKSPGNNKKHSIMAFNIFFSQLFLCESETCFDTNC